MGCRPRYTPKMELAFAIKRTEDNGASFYYAVDNEEAMACFYNPVVDHPPLSDHARAEFLLVVDEAYHAGWSQAELDAFRDSLSREKAALFEKRFFERHRKLCVMLDTLHKLRKETAYKSPSSDDTAFLELKRLETRGVEHPSWWNEMVRVVDKCVSQLMSKEMKCCCILDLTQQRNIREGRCPNLHGFFPL